VGLDFTNKLLSRARSSIKVATAEERPAMAALSQIQASLVSAQNQNTLALANFNLDFSLVKVSAAEEYQGLGTALSQRRRENAEEGPLHRTARKLGALFEQVIPQIYELSEAYGRRVSEIVEHSNAESKVFIFLLHTVKS
jgi:hypothetical protein